MFKVITPGHFTNGDILLVLPKNGTADLQANLLSFEGNVSNYQPVFVKNGIIPI